MKAHLTKIAGCLLASALALTANAANYVKLEPMPGQCETTSINDNAIAVGNCSPANPSANNIPWVANVNTAGSQVELASLVVGQPCYASSVSNGSWIGGTCKNANNAVTGVTWNVTTPGGVTALAPLPGTLLRAADVRTIITAFNQRGDMVGTSISNNGKEFSTIVWLAGTGTPKRVYSSLVGGCI